jgi:predicted MFS family arabinose efflux permease
MNSPQYTLSRQEEIGILAILFIIQLAHTLDFVIMMPLGPQLMRVFAITPKEFGILVSAYTFSAGICGFVNSFYIDKFDRKWALLTACAGLGVSTLLCGLAPSYHFLLFSRIAAGAFGGTIAALVYSVIGDVVPEQRRGAATGLVMAAFSIASVLGIPLGIYFANYAGWHMPFLSLSMIILLTFITGWVLMPSISGHKTAKVERLLHSFYQILADRNHLNTFVFTIALTLSGFTVIPYIATYMVTNAGMTEHDLPYIYFVGGAFTFFSSRFIGKLSDKYGKKLIFSVIAFASMIPILILTHLPPVPLAAALATTTLFMILATGRFVPAMAMITSSVEPMYRGRFMSLNTALQQVACGIAVIISGNIISTDVAGKLYGYEMVGYVSVAAALLAIVLSRRLKIRS